MPSSCLLSKIPGNPDATHAFQKVAVAYDVLSKPTLKRLYDNRFLVRFWCICNETYGSRRGNFQRRHPCVFNDFLDGDLEVIRTLLSLSDSCLNLSTLIFSSLDAVNHINPSVKLGEGINSVLGALQAIRDRALSDYPLFTSTSCHWFNLIKLVVHVSTLFTLNSPDFWSCSMPFGSYRTLIS